MHNNAKFYPRHVEKFLQKLILNLLKHIFANWEIDDNIETYLYHRIFMYREKEFQ